MAVILHLFSFEGPSHNSCDIDVNDSNSKAFLQNILINTGSVVDNSIIKIKHGNITSTGSLTNSTVIQQYGLYNVNTTDNNVIIIRSSQNSISMIVSGVVSTVFSSTNIKLNNTPTVDLGVPLLIGDDIRTGVIAIDASAITIATGIAGKLFRLCGRLNAISGTTPGASYVLKWTEGGVVMTKTLSITALNTDTSFDELIQPDNSTVVTSQVTAISGTGTTINVGATVEQFN